MLFSTRRFQGFSWIFGASPHLNPCRACPDFTSTPTVFLGTCKHIWFQGQVIYICTETKSQWWFKINIKHVGVVEPWFQLQPSLSTLSFGSEVNSNNREDLEGVIVGVFLFYRKNRNRDKHAHSGTLVVSRSVASGLVFSPFEAVSVPILMSTKKVSATTQLFGS